MWSISLWQAQHFDDVLWCFPVCLCLSLANNRLDIPSMYEVMVSTGFRGTAQAEKLEELAIGLICNEAG